jgi:trans-aconitate methyltransferase
VTYLDAQRLAFGSVAELYDAVRPSYPAAALDDVIAHAGLRPGDRMIEVGAGTGKLTALLVARGQRVLAIEPSAEMAAVLRGRELDGVEIAETGFEQWRPDSPAPALVSAAAWHWTAPELRYRLAAAAVTPGGTLAAIWTLPDWQGCALRDDLRPPPGA